MFTIEDRVRNALKSLGRGQDDELIMELSNICKQILNFERKHVRATQQSKTVKREALKEALAKKGNKF